MKTRSNEEFEWAFYISVLVIYKHVELLGRKS